VLATVVLTFPARAGAQTRDAAAGEALFQEGRRLMKAGEFTSACPKLEESLRLDPALGTLVNLASCEEQLGHTATAWQHWRSAADQLPSGDKRRATAVGRAAALEKLLPRLTIAFAAEVSPDVEVRRDGVRLGKASLGLPLPVDPGRHVVVVSAPGREPRQYEATLEAKENESLTVEPGAEIKVARAPDRPPERWNDDRTSQVVARPLPPPPAGKQTSVLGWTLVGTGAAALAGAGYFGLQALSARKDAEKSCPGAAPSVCWKDARDPLDRDRRNSLLADISAGAGLVLAGAGLFFILHTPGETTTAQVAPLPGGGAVQLAGSF
jgi:tetratricopeptide (TPR) repeat protein